MDSRVALILIAALSLLRDTAFAQTPHEPLTGDAYRAVATFFQYDKTITLDLALDAQYHGERSVNNDYLSIREMYFEQMWFARYRDMLIESTRGYLRALTQPASAAGRRRAPR